MTIRNGLFIAVLAVLTASACADTEGKAPPAPVSRDDLAAAQAAGLVPEVVITEQADGSQTQQVFYMTQAQAHAKADRKRAYAAAHAAAAAGEPVALTDTNTEDGICNDEDGDGNKTCLFNSTCPDEDVWLYTTQHPDFETDIRFCYHRNSGVTTGTTDWTATGYNFAAVWTGNDEFSYAYSATTLCHGINPQGFCAGGGVQCQLSDSDPDFYGYFWLRGLGAFSSCYPF